MLQKFKFFTMLEITKVMTDKFFHLLSVPKDIPDHYSSEVESR